MVFINVFSQLVVRQGYMKYELNLMEKYKDGKAEGINEGVSIGEANERNRMVKEMNANGIPIPVIARCASISEGQVEEILKS